MKTRPGHAVRRFMAAWLSLLLIAGMMPIVVLAEEDAPRRERPTAATLARYNDLPDSAYYLEALAHLTDRGIIEPDEAGGFAPNAPLTRAEFAVWLARSVGLPPAAGSAFTDVPAGAKEAPYIQALHEAEIMQGYGDGTFRGDRPITRAEAAALLARITGMPGAPRHAAAFGDVRPDDWFAGAVGTLANMRVISGKSKGRFAPADKLTRGEAAVLLHRLLFEERRIEALGPDAVTIGGHAYRWVDALSGLFREENHEALLGASIEFVSDGDIIESVTFLEVTGSGADPDQLPVLDAGGAAIDGSLHVSADEAIIANIAIKRNFLVSPASRNAVMLFNVKVEGQGMLAPAGARTDGRRFMLLYANAAFGDGVFVSRDAFFIHLAEPASDSPTSDAPKPDATMSNAKNGKPVVILNYVYDESKLDALLAASEYDGPRSNPVSDMLEEVNESIKKWISTINRYFEQFDEYPKEKGSANKEEQVTVDQQEPADREEQEDADRKKQDTADRQEQEPADPLDIWVRQHLENRKICWKNWNGKGRASMLRFRRCPNSNPHPRLSRPNRPP